MSLSLTPETEQRIATELAASSYQSADELILAGLKLLNQREQRLNELREQINIGAEQIAQGKLTDGEVVFDRLFEKLRPTPNA